MSTAPEKFYNESVKKIFKDKKSVVDIGGGLRISRQHGNWYDASNKWIAELAKETDYKIMDPTYAYTPDIIGDIHEMPFSDDSQEAIVCVSVLEHVKDPIRAAKELYRVLQPGGYLFVYVPFLYYYHAEPGYYGDFWRFTRDSIKFIFQDFNKMDIVQTRGALETWIKISPLGRFRFVLSFAHLWDRILGKDKSNQTSGYYVFLIK